MPGCSFLGEWASEITFQQGDNKCIILKFDMLSYVPSTLSTVSLVVIFFKIISSSTGLTEQTWVIPFLECINSLFLTQQMKKAGPKQLTCFYQNGCLVTGSSHKAGG